MLMNKDADQPNTIPDAPTVVTDNDEAALDLKHSATLQNSMSVPSLQRSAEEELSEAKAALDAQTAELARYVALLSATLESVADGVLAMDLDGQVLAYNTKFASIWHFPPDFLQRKNRREFVDFEASYVKNPEAFRELCSRHLAQPEQENVDVIEMLDGRTFECFSIPQNINERCVGVVISLREITERRQVEQALAVFAAIVDSSHDAIISKTLDGIITSWNYGAERLFGYRAEEAIGQPILMLIPPERAGEEPLIIARQKRGEGVDHIETVRLHKSGERIHVSITLSPIKDSHGRVVGVSKIARDITQRKHTEFEREELLARERQSRHEAESANRVKDEFLATLSHELRTPLTAIMGWTSILQSTELNSEESARGLSTIERNARVQAQLVEDILDVSRVITGKMRLDIQTIDLSLIIEEALNSVLPAARAKNIQLDRVIDETASRASGDPARVRQIIWNLLANAIKFTPNGGRVEVQLRQAGEQVEIIISDNGQGISPEVLPFIFDRFRQADSTSTRRHGGLGLGLAIVRHLAELHGGSAEAISEGEGRGAVFSVKLPYHQVSEPGPVILEKRAKPSIAQTTASESMPSLEGLRILVVDDQEDTRSFLSVLLEKAGAHATTVPSAFHGFRLIQELKPDILISDIGMPDEDGFSFIKRVRTLTPHLGGRTPAIALTAFARSEDRVNVLRAGFQTHLRKPVDSIELVTVIAKLTGRLEHT
jgi:PAS domain S-box-containing protein